MINEPIHLAPIPKRSCPSDRADANSLIARFGDNADHEAGDRAQRSTVIDSDRTRGHWTGSGARLPFRGKLLETGTKNSMACEPRYS